MGVRMKTYIFLAASLSGFQGQVLTQNDCPSSATTYTEVKPPIVPEWDRFNSHWFDVTDKRSTNEMKVNSYFTDLNLQNDICLGLRYRMADPNVTFASGFLTGSSIAYDELKKPNWLDYKCNNKGCKVRMCCPTVVSRNEVSTDSDCSKITLQFHENATITPDTKFWSHWMDKTSPHFDKRLSAEQNINPVAFSPEWRTDLCRGLRLKAAVPDFPFKAWIMDADDNYKLSNEIPPSMAVRCADEKCSRYQAQYCCKPLIDENEPARQMALLVRYISDYVDTIHEKDRKFKVK